MNNQLSFQNIVFNSYQHQGQLWLTSNELGLALEYADDKAIQRIYARHSDEFTPGMTTVVKLTTNGINNSLREIEVRIYSIRGAHLIAMFARTPIAKEFRRWALDILDRETDQMPRLAIAPTFPCRILHSFNEYGAITGARVAQEGEELMNPANAAEYVQKMFEKRGVVMFSKVDLAKFTV